jgi:hypothetical protein
MTRRPWSALLALLAGLCLAGPGSAGSPLTLDDVVSLVAAKVGDAIILRQAASSGLAFEVGVGEILKLKEAGAGDSLIEALMRLGPPPDAGAEPSLPFRIFKETTSDGQEVLHITNLDASGRRIGGEVLEDHRAPLNQYASREEEAAGASGRGQGYGDDDLDPGPAAPVVVNVYPPQPEPVSEPGWSSPYVYRDPYAHLYPRGRLPGYHPGYYGGHYYGRQRLVPSPPGSYTHFLKYHTHYGGTHVTGCATSSTFGPRLGPGYRPVGPASGWESLHAMRARVGTRR